MDILLRSSRGIRIPHLEAARGRQPYILRVEHHDPQGRIKRGDLLLVRQEPRSEAEFGVFKTQGRLVLARRQAPGRWQDFSTGQPLASDTEPVGVALAILWALL